MNLDDLKHFKELDSLDMLGEIDGLPNQLQSAWELGQTLPLPEISEPNLVVISGMGGSAIGADLVATAIAATCAAPVIVHRNYGLPAFARGKSTLFIASSHSGNTEETLDSFDTARKRDCTIMAVTTGGELGTQASNASYPLWTFEHEGQPRAAVGFSFGLLLALLARLKLTPDPEKEVLDAVAAMKLVQPELTADVLATKNAAKRYAGQLVGRWVTVFGADLMEPVARRMKTQINEIAKAAANFEFVPEANHNALAGTLHPEEVMAPRTISLFLRAASDHPRNRKRLELTRQTFMLDGLNTDFVDARGDTPLAQMWTTILFGDYMAYYLAMAYGVDPTPVEALSAFKAAMKEEIL